MSPSRAVVVALLVAGAATRLLLAGTDSAAADSSSSLAVAGHDANRSMRTLATDTLLARRQRPFSPTSNALPVGHGTVQISRSAVGDGRRR
jgi:hypothetical protein